MDWELFKQLTTNGVINGSWYALLGLGFGVILHITGRFHLAFAATYTVSAYTALEVAEHTGAPLPLSIVCGLLGGVVAGLLMERLVYRPVAASGGALLTIFVASLGITIVVENAIRLKLGSSSKVLSGFPIHAIRVFGVHFTSLDAASVLTVWFLIAAVALFLQHTSAGRSINAVRVNPEMARVVGIDPDRVYLWVFAMGSFLGGVLALYTSMKYAAVPDMGLQPILYAFVVAFIGGISNIWFVGLVGVALGLAESWTGLWLSAQWSSLVVFSILFIYVAVRSVRLPRPAKLIALLVR
jgi:branched-chain amino acid transport system permease protein